MKKKTIIWIGILWIICGFALMSKAAAHPNLTGHKPLIDKAINQEFRNLFSILYRRGQFNGIVLIAEKGMISFEGAYGHADFKKNSIFYPNLSVFDVASVSKPFTAVAVMKMVEQGHLKLSDSVEKFLTAFPFRKITIRQLLTHSSGLPDFRQFFYDRWDTRKIASNRDVYHILLKTVSKLAFVPGTKCEYSNTNYMLLAMIVETISGKSFPDFCHSHIFEPLGMNSTGIYTHAEEQNLKHFVRDYIYQYAKRSYIDVGKYPDFDNVTFTADMYGSAGLSTTARDLLKFDSALYSEQLLKNSTKKILFEPLKLKAPFDEPLAMGWFIKQEPGLGKSIYHPGGYGGYRALLQRFPDKEITLIVLANVDVPIWGIRTAMLNILKGEAIKYPKQSVIRVLNSKLDSLDPSGIRTEFKRLKSEKDRYYIRENDFSFWTADLFDAGSFRKASIAYDLYTEQYPKSVLAWQGLGDVYRKTGNRKEALEAYRKGLKLDPDDQELKKRINSFK